MTPGTLGCRTLPTTEGHHFFHGFTDPYNPTFVERLLNVIVYIKVYLNLPPPQVSREFNDILTKIQPQKTLQELFHDSQMFFINLDLICLDFPRVSAPHYIFVGGMGVKEVKPLEGQLAEDVDKAQDGLIICSFGTAVKRLPKEILQILFEAFATRRELVIMRHDGDVTVTPPDNVRLYPWLPQNDLLAHAKTRLFVSHGGNNGQMEAVRHGVPMVTIPIFSDQFYNAKRVVARGYGRTVPYREMTSELLSVAMEEVLSNPHV